MGPILYGPGLYETYDKRTFHNKHNTLYMAYGCPSAVGPICIKEFGVCVLSKCRWNKIAPYEYVSTPWIAPRRPQEGSKALRRLPEDHKDLVCPGIPKEVQEGP